MFKNIELLINKKIKFQIVILLTFSFFVALLEMLSLGSLPIFIETIFNYEKILHQFNYIQILDDFLKNNEKKDIIIYFSLVIFFLFLIKNLITILYIFFEKFLVYKIRILNSKKLYESLINDKYVEHLKKDISKVNRNFLYDIDGACSVIEHIMIIFREILVLIALAVLLSFQNPFIFFSLMLLFMFCGSLYYFLLRGKIIRLSTKALINRKEKISYLNQTFRNFVNIRIYNLNNIFKKKYIFFLKDTERFKIFVNIITSITKPIFETFAFLSVVLIIIYSFKIGIKEYDLLPALTLLVVIAYRLMPLINNLTNSFAKIKSKQVVLDEICRDITKYNNLTKLTLNLKDFEFKNLIEINNINYFQSQNEKNIFNNYNLKIKKGEKIFIHGKTGRGKSTLLNIISGLISPDKGSVLVDNIEINNNLRGWQQNISYVEQKAFLFKDNLKNNITMLEDTKDFNEAYFKKILKICFLEDFYEKRKEQTLDEDGTLISGGEKQRIVIARAIYKNRKILILDEATNAINSEIEEEILKNILNELNKNTIICVSHNLKNKNIFDKIIDLDKLN